jgi:hypothetical protein
MMNASKKKILSAYFPELKDLVENTGDSTASFLAMAIVDKIQSLKGEKGDTPVKGQDYFTEQELNQIVSYIKDMVVTPELIKKATPVKGKDYVDGKNYVLTDSDKKDIAKSIKVPVVDKIIEKTEVIREIPSVIKDVVTKKQLDEITKGILDGMVKVDGRIKAIDQRWGGKGLSRVSHDSTLSGDGTTSSPLTVVGGSGGTVAVETPSGTINGTNATFTVLNTPKWITINGITYYENDGYTLSGLTITIVTSIIPLTGSTLRSIYSSGSGVTVETPSGTINGVNATFTVTNTPKWVTINGVTYYENDGYTLSGLTLTIVASIIPMTGSTLRSIY